MIRQLASRKVLRYGLIGLAGAVVGCLLGELLFLLPRPAGGGAPSLVARPEPPPPPPEFKSRLDRAGAKTGDLQLSLLWNNSNDLVLHCYEPDGTEISYRHRMSRSGGHLDVDQNRGCSDTVTDPIENIYWPKGAAAAGEYRVFVNYYARCGSEAFPTDFKLNALVGGERREFAGTLKAVQNSQLVHTFTVARGVKLYPAQAEVSLRSDAPTRLTVEVDRVLFKGPVTVKADNLPAGVSAEPVTLPDGQDRCEMVFHGGVGGGPVTVQLVGTGPTSDVIAGTADVQLLPPPWWSWWTILLTALWTAALAGGLATALLVGQNLYLGRPWLAEPRQLLAAAGTAAGGFAAGVIGQAFQFLFAVVGLPGFLGYLIGWALLGGLVGGVTSLFIPNLSRNKAAVAGVVGGVLGVLGFLALAGLAVGLGRFFGGGVLGFCIGAMVALVEVAFRRAWLEVRFGERETISVNLGPEPVKVGGDSKACTVWVRGARDVALRYFVRDGQVVCHDLGTNGEQVTAAGTARTLGNVTLTVRTSGAAVPTTAPPSPPPAPPRPAASPPPPPPRVVLAADDPPYTPPRPPSPPSAPKPSPPVATKPPAPTMPRPPVPGTKPTAPVPSPPAAPKPPAPTGAATARCPECGEVVEGRPGVRLCRKCGAMS